MSMVVGGLALHPSGAFGTFIAGTSDNQTVASGTVAIAVGSIDRVTVGKAGMRPGDSVYRAVDIVNQPTLTQGGLGITTGANPSSVLDTDTTNGLQLAVDVCSTAWTESGSAPNYTYTCPGTQQVSIAQRPIIFSSIQLLHSLLTVGATNHYRLTVTLPTTSPSSAQAQSSTIKVYYGSQGRAGTEQ
ncbi:MAG TPA: hypothetical protein VFF40_04125 [Acidimicrobiia bacterium]|nr:hypothetical protein [Acidimicrobiia bacterium]